MRKNIKKSNENEEIIKKIKEKSEKNDILFDEERSINNFNDEFIPEFNHWLSIEEQKEKAKEIENITKEK